MSVVYSRRLKKELQEIQIEQADPAKKAAGASIYATLVTGYPISTTTNTPRWIGIQLLQAEDLKTWYFSIEVLGESLYKVRLLHIKIFNDSPPSPLNPIYPIPHLQIFPE
jgi:hypothetical protein